MARVSTPPPVDPLDAAEVDPDAGSAAALPGHGAQARTTPAGDEPAGAGDTGTGEDAPVGPPSQDF